MAWEPICRSTSHSYINICTIKHTHCTLKLRRLTSLNTVVWLIWSIKGLKCNHFRTAVISPPRGLPPPPIPPFSWKPSKTQLEHIFTTYFGCNIGLFLMIFKTLQEWWPRTLLNIAINSEQELHWRKKKVNIKSARAEYHIFCEYVAPVEQK